MRSSVLLPAPFGPSTARHSPAARSTSTRSTARRSPNRFTRPARADQLPPPLQRHLGEREDEEDHRQEQPFDWAKAAWTREVSPGRTMAFS